MSSAAFMTGALRVNRQFFNIHRTMDLQEGLHTDNDWLVPLIKDLYARVIQILSL